MCEADRYRATLCRHVIHAGPNERGASSAIPVDPFSVVSLVTAPSGYRPITSTRRFWGSRMPGPVATSRFVCPKRASGIATEIHCGGPASHVPRVRGVDDEAGRVAIVGDETAANDIEPGLHAEQRPVALGSARELQWLSIRWPKKQAQPERPEFVADGVACTPEVLVAHRC